MNQEQILSLLQSLLSPSNEVRTAAEAEYENLKKQRSVVLLQGIIEVCATSSDASIVLMGLVLLRKEFNSDECSYDNANAETATFIKGRMLEILGACVSGRQRASAAACVSALAIRIYQKHGSWPELWDSVFKIISSSDSPNNMKTISCEIISSTAAVMFEFFNSHADDIASSMNLCLSSSGEGHIGVKKAAFEVVMKIASLGPCEKFAPLVPLMMNVIQELLNAEDWDSAESLTSCVAEGISVTPKLFSSCIIPLLTSMMQVASSLQVARGVRHMAIEALLSYCEADAKSIRKIPDFSTSFFELLFQYVLQASYSEEWDVTAMEDDEEYVEGDLDVCVGCAGLDRLSIALGGRKLNTIAQSLFMQNISSENWCNRNAAVLLICHVSEGMSNVLKKMLPALVSSIIPSITDEVKYVRANALDCLSQFGTDFSPDIELKLHGQVLPPVIAALRDPVPRVAASAAKCLDIFFDAILTDDESDVDDATLSTFKPYVERVCVDSVALLHSTTHNFVRKAALGALSSLTSSCKSLLSPYANELVKVYQEILSNPDSPELLDIKCKTIECVTLLACGVGKEVFAPYAHDICNFLGSMSTGGLRTDDPRSKYVFRGWTCMVECLKEDVLPYMGQVMPALLTMMNVNCDPIIEDADSVDEDKETDEGYDCCRITIPGVGEKVAKLHTSTIEDKELASNIVNSMLQQLGIALQPFFQDIATSAISMLSFSFNPSIRENGALIISEIIDACNSSQNNALSAELAKLAFPELMSALEDEADADTMDTLIQSLSQCVHAEPSIISNPQMVCEKLVGTMNAVVEQLETCATNILTEQDEDEIDNLHDEQEELENSIRSLTDLLGSLLQCASTVFTPVFIEKLLPIISTWLTPEKDDFMVGRGLVILCDFVEHSSNFVASSVEHIMQLAVSFASTRTDEELLQSNFFLLSLLAQYIGANVGENPATVKFAKEAHAALFAYFATNKGEEYANCTTNAISAYVALLQNFPSGLQAESLGMLETITANLPAKDDEVEAKRIHDWILQWIVLDAPFVASVEGCKAAMLQRIKTAEPKYLSSQAQEKLSSM